MRLVSRLSGTLSLFREMHFKKVTYVHLGLQGRGGGGCGESQETQSPRGRSLDPKIKSEEPAFLL